jgi:hypothetical protein
MTATSQGYWDAARRQELVVPTCEACGHLFFPPRAHCPVCGSAELAWRAVSGRGTVYSYTVAHRPPHPVFAEQCPLAVAIVELDEGPRMISNIIGCDAERLSVGMAVQVAFEPIDDSDVVLPVFAPA